MGDGDRSEKDQVDRKTFRHIKLRDGLFRRRCRPDAIGFSSNGEGPARLKPADIRQRLFATAAIRRHERNSAKNLKIGPCMPAILRSAFESERDFRNAPAKFPARQTRRSTVKRSRFPQL